VVGSGRIPYFAVAALAGAALSGCGGSSKLSRPDFVAKADALCAQSNKTAPKLPPKNAREAAVQAAAEVAGRTLLDSQLKHLKAPDEVKTDFDSYNAGTQKVIAWVRQQELAAEQNNEARYTSLASKRDADSAARGAVGKRIGFKVCGQSQPAPKG
jgi:hypothetical protein